MFVAKSDSTGGLTVPLTIPKAEESTMSESGTALCIIVAASVTDPNTREYFVS